MALTVRTNTSGSVFAVAFPAPGTVRVNVIAAASWPMWERDTISSASYRILCRVVNPAI